METRDYKTSVEAREMNGRKVISGYGIVFNSDSENLGGFIEQVDPRAVVKTLVDSDIRGMADHSTGNLLGRVKAGTMRLTTDTKGVRYEIDVNEDDPVAQSVYARVKRGDMSGSSFCFETLQESWDWDATPARRRLLEIKVIEMGPVAFPAYPDTTAAARSALKRVAEKLGHSAERMAEALKAGEIRSLIDKAETDARIIEAAQRIDDADEEYRELREMEEKQSASDAVFGVVLNVDGSKDPEATARAVIEHIEDEKRVGKKLSASTLAALQRAVQELTDLMEPNEEPDGDEDDMMISRALDICGELTQELRGRPDEEPAPAPLSWAQNLLRVRERELEALQQRWAA